MILLIRLLLAAVISAIVSMAWGFLFWTVLPLAGNTISRVDNEDSIITTLQENDLKSGVYVIPSHFPPEDGSMSEEEKQKWMEKQISQHKQGPLVHLFYRTEGADMKDPKLYIKGMVHFFVSSLIAGILILVSGSASGGFIRRFCIVFFAGLFGIVFIQLSNPVWFHHSWDYALMLASYDFVGSVLIGIVMATIVRRKYIAV